jgi:hypothetical protein
MIKVLDDAGRELAERTYYECGGGRKTFYAVAFILLLPFFVSLPVMIGQRIIAGVWLDTWGLIVIGVAFLIIMALVLFELVFSLRAKVDIGTNAVAFTLPTSGAGLSPTLFYQSRTIPYSEIEAIQSYCDCYGGTVTPVVLRATRLVLKSGERLKLGYVNEADDDPRFPFNTIARQISERSGIEITDLGHVKYAMRQRMFGPKNATAPAAMPPEAIQQINKGHNVFLTGVVVVMAVLLTVGIGKDLWNNRSDLGERAATEKVLQR